MTLDGMCTCGLTGRVALVSGASRGIGYAIAAALPLNALVNNTGINPAMLPPSSPTPPAGSPARRYGSMVDRSPPVFLADVTHEGALHLLTSHQHPQCHQSASR